MALIGAQLLLAQHFEPLDFISRVLNPRLIGFAVVRVIYASSKDSGHGPGWDFSRDREPERPELARSGRKRHPGVLGHQILGQQTSGHYCLAVAGTELELNFGLREDFIFHWHLAKDRVRPCSSRVREAVD